MAERHTTTPENRITALTESVQGQNRQWHYDAVDRLTSATGSDGNGRRVAAIEMEGEAQTETRHAWCGDRICQARNERDEALAYYFDEGEYRPQGGARTYYARDHLGSVRDMLDAEGKNLARYDYDPYGNFIDRPMKAPEFGYAGMRHHAPSGLYLTQYRAYDPRTGRWLSRDPIEEAGGINLYGYVKGNPIAYRDPLGLSPAAGLCTATGPGVFVCVAVVGSLTLGMMIYARIIASRYSSSSSMGGIIEGYDERGQYVSGIQTSAENCPPAQGGSSDDMSSWPRDKA